MPVRAEELALLGEERLGLVAEREQRLFRPEAGAGLHERDDFVGRHRVRAGLTGIAAERAVVAVIAAERGERDEHLLRERHGAAAAAIAQLAGAGEQVGQTRLRRGDQATRFVVGDHCRECRLLGMFRGWAGLIVLGSASPALSFSLALSFSSVL